MENLKRPVESKQYIYSRGKMSSYVEAIGTCSLVLSSSFILCLEKTFYVPIFFKNLIFVSRLAPLGFSFNFSNFGFSLINKSGINSSGALLDGFTLLNFKMMLPIILCMLLLG